MATAQPEQLAFMILMFKYDCNHMLAVLLKEIFCNVFIVKSTRLTVHKMVIMMNKLAHLIGCNYCALTPHICVMVLKLA